MARRMKFYTEFFSSFKTQYDEDDAKNIPT